jgi:thymidine phosphorylase
LHTAKLIQKKRDGSALSGDEIRSLVQGITDLSITDAQIAAFAMAVWFRGMDIHEQSALTLAMRDSGTILNWSGLHGPVLDKHSTGGVGDLVSLVLGPLVAASGAYVPMISGRGLSHTGGTLDKLESIPGFNTRLDKQRFQQLVKESGIAIIGQTEDLAPADGRIYSVRDVTATVSSIPLIVSSILSKKLAEGLDGLVIDIKVGGGAFMQEMEHAQLLALDICRVAVEAGVNCNAVITDMSQPISLSAGNALEVHEAVAYLKGEYRHDRLHAVVIALAAELLVIGNLAADRDAARVMLDENLASGKAAECFSRMVAGQGGPVDFLDQPGRYLKAAKLCKPVLAVNQGFVAAVDIKAIGLAVVKLGGGRIRAEDHINHAVGVSGLCQPGKPVTPDTPLAMIHAESETDWDRAANAVQQAVRVADFNQGEARVPVVREHIEGGK